MVSRTQHTNEKFVTRTREGEYFKNLKKDEKEMFEEMYE
jgi:hypothetical protein